MDYTALDLCLGENGLDCVFESGRNRPTQKKQNILHTTVFSGR